MLIRDELEKSDDEDGLEEKIVIFGENVDNSEVLELSDSEVEESDPQAYTSIVDADTRYYDHAQELKKLRAKKSRITRDIQSDMKTVNDYN